MKKISEILVMFGLSAEITSIEKINSGHINSTYKIIYSPSEKYILQSINGFVFKHPEMIMSNIEGICNCLKGKVHCPEFLKYQDRNYIMCDNEMWRVYRYIGNSVSYNTLDNSDKLFEFGRVTGEFHKLSENLDTDKFHTVIENFHNTEHILHNLLALKNSEYKTEFDFFERSLELSEMLTDKKLPLNVTHNDVKCSNVLFDASNGKGITLIDFDTVMPGLTVYDFGDGARSACVTQNAIDIEKFAAYCKGYFSQIMPQSAENYFLGMYCITSELAARYFHDFLTDENYFADKTPSQKLMRSRELISLAESILSEKENIISTIKDFE